MMELTIRKNGNYRKINFQVSLIQNKLQSCKSFELKRHFSEATSLQN